MDIQPNKLTISQLFATGNEQFIVPAYQRRYAWGINQYKALFEDIDMLKENDGHLFGMIILHSSTHTGGLNKPELVDGQQRMTTLVILLKALETVYRDKGKIEKADDIRKMIFCKDLNDVERPKIVLGDLDNNDIEMLILRNKEEEIENDNIKNALIEYKQWLTDYNLEELNKFYFKLTNIAVIIRLDVGIAQDAYKLFETINNRGLRLTPTDIIKNFFLGHAAKIDVEDTLIQVKTIWANIIKNLDSLDSDDFLRQFICSVLHQKVSMSKLVPQLKKYYITHVQNTELLGEYEYFQENDLNYYGDEDEINDNEASEIINNNNVTRINIMKFLSQTEVFSKLTLFVGEENIIDKIKNYISENGYMPDNSEFSESFPRHQFKGRLIDRAKYVLETIEYYLRGDTDELVISSSEEVHLEHIIPQTINTKKSKEEYGDWQTYLGDGSVAKHKKYVNYIGNMTLLGEALNIQAYNNPFAKKKSSYRRSSFLISQELADYSDFKFYHVDKRSEQLRDVALKIWND